jgi:hypothetical protein
MHTVLFNRIISESQTDFITNEKWKLFLGLVVNKVNPCNCVFRLSENIWLIDLI